MEGDLTRTREVRSSGKSIGEISRDLDLTETAVRQWVPRTGVDGGRRNGMSTAEREERSRLRRQVRVLDEERSILKKAATFFANEIAIAEEVEQGTLVPDVRRAR